MTRLLWRKRLAPALAGTSGPARLARFSRLSRLSRLSILVLLAAPAGLALLGCSTERNNNLPSIVLISIDTLRSDHLPVYGYSEVETPAIDALRGDGILFEHAYSHAPTTLPAHASMLTGLLPPEHGVRGNGGYRLEATGLPYLPSLLKARGYSTGAALSSFVMRRETGFDTDFDLYEDGSDASTDSAGPAELSGRDSGDRQAARSTRLQRAGSKTLEASLPWLRSRDDGPFFFFLHLYEPHTPYSAPEPFASRYASAYDGEIAAADAVVGDLIRELRKNGRYDNTAVILTSDHGEGLGDHGEDEHGIFLYRESIQVPLIVKLPAGRDAGQSVASPVQLVDILPTVLDLVGAEAPPELPGVSLVSGLDDPSNPRQIYSETYFPRFFFGWSELTSIVEGSLQYIESPEPELYDLATDFYQRNDLVHEQTDTARRLRSQLAQIDSKLAAPVDTNIETWRKMAALGYVGHGQLRVDKVLPAPRSQVHLLAIMKEGFRNALDGDHLSAVDALESVVDENPFALAAWEQLARSNELIGRTQEAIRAYSQALELSDNAPHLLLALAQTNARAGDYGRARELADRAHSWDPGLAEQVLTRVALANKDLEAAEQHAQASLAAEPANSAVLFMLAQIQLQRSAFDEALETVKKTERVADGPMPKLELLRANILASAGRLEEAEQALHRELEAFPEGTLAYSRLAILLARRGRTQEAIDTLQRLVEHRSDPIGYAAAVRTLVRLGDPRSAQGLLAQAIGKFPNSPELAALRQSEILR